MLNTLIVVLPLLKFSRNRIKMASVVVLIPPPTELGEDPINMSPPITNCVASEKRVKSIVVKPALLVVADWNIA